MKKNKLFRLLTVALTLVFLCLLAVPAFAYPDSMTTTDREIEDSYADTGGSGYTYYFRVQKYGGISQRPNVQAITQKKYHTYGQPTYFYAGTYQIYSASGLMNSGYSDIRTLAQRIDVKPSYSLSAYTNAITVPATEATGYYSLSTTFFDYRGEYEVQIDRGMGREAEEFAIYPYAAQESIGISGFVRCS